MKVIPFSKVQVPVKVEQKVKYVTETPSLRCSYLTVDFRPSYSRKINITHHPLILTFSLAAFLYQLRGVRVSHILFQHLKGNSQMMMMMIDDDDDDDDDDDYYYYYYYLSII